MSLQLDADGIKVKDWVIGEYTIEWRDINNCYYGYYWGTASFGFRTLIPRPIINIETTPQAKDKIKHSLIWLGWDEYIYNKYELMAALEYFSGNGIYNYVEANKSQRIRKVLVAVVFCATTCVIYVIIIDKSRRHSAALERGKRLAGVGEPSLWRSEGFMLPRKPSCSRRCLPYRLRGRRLLLRCGLPHILSGCRRRR